MLLTSTLLEQVRGVRHGFSTRLGGLTSGPTGTWNFTPGVEHAVENRQRMATALGLTGHEALCEIEQVHGAHIVWAPEGAAQKADAIATKTADHAVGVVTADCAPVLFAAADGSVVAATHAGWRGAVAGVLKQTVDALAERGADPATLVAAIGPCIGVDAFEVGPEVITAAEEALGGKAPARAGEGDRMHLNLRELVRLLLMQAGLREDNIDTVGGCTHSNIAMHYSYRRDGPGQGRQLSAIRRGASS